MLRAPPPHTSHPTTSTSYYSHSYYYYYHHNRHHHYYGAALAALIASAAGYIAYVGPGYLWGAGYQPTPKRVVEEVVGVIREYLASRGGAVGALVADVGGGYGRVAFSLLRDTGCHVLFVEPDPVKAWWVGRQAARKGYVGRIFIQRRSALDPHVGLGDADAVYMFLTPHLTQRVAARLAEELRPGALVISYQHAVKGWTPVRVTRSGLNIYVVAPSTGTGQHLGVEGVEGRKGKWRGGGEEEKKGGRKREGCGAGFTR